MGDWKSGQPEGATPFLGELNKRFRVRRLLGSGGMSIVLEAHDEKLGRDVAIKLIRCGSGADARARRLLREAKAVSRLRSRHVASVLDWGWLDEQAPFIVMELLNGRDLGTVLRTDGPLPLGRALRCMIAACDALVEAHGAGIIHRDVKPSNLFVVAEGGSDEVLKVLDFGLAKELHGDGGSMSLTLGAQLLGTPRYMAPEQLTRSTALDQRVDVWAAAVTTYELVSGCVPFQGKTKAELWHSILYEPARRLSEDLERVPQELEALLLACLEKRPSARLSNLRRFSEALQELLEKLPSAELAEPAKLVERPTSDESATLTPSSVVLPSRSTQGGLGGSPPPKTTPLGPRLALLGLASGLLIAGGFALAPDEEPAAPAPLPLAANVNDETSFASTVATVEPAKPAELGTDPPPAVTRSSTVSERAPALPRRRALAPANGASVVPPASMTEAASEPKAANAGADLDRALRTRR